MDNYLQSLNPPQEEAVLHTEGPLLILAGPGSGKTRVITSRVAHLLKKGVPGSQILALTFTNKAADEMNQRLERMVGNQSVWMGTFHRFCAQLLRIHASLVGLQANYSIYDTDDSRRILREVIESEEVDISMTSPNAIAAAISAAKNKLVLPSQYRAGMGNPLGGLVAELYPAYQSRLLQANAVDFDDLLLHVATMLKENEEIRRQFDARYQYILVDEYQDTNLAQYTIVRSMSIDVPNLAVTGDPDQSIYGWRGANLNNILGFENDYDDVKVVRLEQNYRSTPNILEVADALITHNVRRKHKTLFTEQEGGEPVRFVQFPSGRDEADSIANRIAADVNSGKRDFSDFAVFYRVNTLTRQLEQSLADHGIPFQIVHGVEFYQRKEIKDVLAYLHLINNPQSDVAFLRVINTPARGIGKTSLRRLAEYAGEKRIPLLDAARQAGLVTTLQKRACLSFAKFVSMYDRLCLHVHEPLLKLTEFLLIETGYREYLEKIDTEEDAQRVDNIDELLSAMFEYDQQLQDCDNRLERFLERVALVNDTDEWETTTNLVTLMTLHAAKGLEFPSVFVIGVEEGTLPHHRSRDDPNQMEEERRLLFVGITRAEQELQISMADQRNLRGRPEFTVCSQFLNELPRHCMDWHAMSPSLTRNKKNTNDPYGFDEYFDPIDDQDEEQELYNQAGEADRSAMLAEVDALKLVTASQMVDDGVPNLQGPPDPESITSGMLVTHPQYGPGQVVKVSGKQKKRRATVHFFNESEPRSFVLIHCELRPVQSPMQ